MITSYKELTIKKWQEVLTAQSIGFDWYEKDLQMVSILSGIPFDDLKRNTIAENKLLKDNMDFLNEAPSDKLITEFTLCGVDYVAKIDVRDKTAGQFIDISTFTADADKVNENLHNILAVICLPVGCKYDGESVLGRGEIFQNNLTMDVAYPLAVFFYTVYINTLKDIADSSANEAEQMSKDLLEEVEGMKTPTDGSLQSIV